MSPSSHTQSPNVSFFNISENSTSTCTPSPTLTNLQLCMHWGLPVCSISHFSCCWLTLWFQPSHKMMVIVMILIDGVTEVLCPRTKRPQGTDLIFDYGWYNEDLSSSDSSHMLAKQAHAYLPRLSLVSTLLPHQGCLPTLHTVPGEWTYKGLNTSLYYITYNPPSTTNSVILCLHPPLCWGYKHVCYHVWLFFLPVDGGDWNSGPHAYVTSNLTC